MHSMEQDVFNYSGRRNWLGLKIGAGVLSLTAILTACGTSGHAARQVAAPVTTSTSALGSVYEGPVIQRRVDGWFVECDGPLSPVKARSGDSILDLAHRNKTFLHETSVVGQTDVSPPAWGLILAELNKLPDENKIYQGTTYQMPASCFETNDPSAA